MQNKKYGAKEGIFTPNLKSSLACISQKIAHLFFSENLWNNLMFV